VKLKAPRLERVGGIQPSPVIPSRVTDYLLPYERNVLTVRLHPGVLAGHSLLLACACAATISLTVITDSGASVLSAAWGACSVIFLSLIFRVAKWYYSYVVLTDARLIFITGLLAPKVTTVPTREISSLKLHQSWLGRLIGYATFIAEPSKPGYRIPRIDYMPWAELLFQEMSSALFPDLDPRSRELQ
jgi:hypothetical protein